MIASFSRLSLLWKILLSTSVAVTLLFALTGWIVLRNAVDTTTQHHGRRSGRQPPGLPVAVESARRVARLP